MTTTTPAPITLATATVAPCGATYGTAAGPNDGRTRCGGCGEVHPVQYVFVSPPSNGEILVHLTGPGPTVAAHTYTPTCAGHHPLTAPCPVAE